MKVRGLAIGFLLSATVVTSTEAINVFQIGNSLTWDSQPTGIQAMAESAGLIWTGGHHIRGASSIKQIYDDPTQSNDRLSLPGPTWVEGLPENDWDVLTIQPHNSSGNTMGHDIDYALLFREAAKSQGRNLDIQMYVYSSWPTLSTNWADWLTSVPNELTQLTVHRRQFYEHVAARLSDTLSEPVHVIPAGDVLYRLKQEIEAGTIPNITSMSALYRDNIHMSSYGQFAAGSTVLATLAGINPTGIVPADEYGSMNPETVLRIQEIVWDVVANHPWSGVTPISGDYNGDESVDLADYQWWRRSFGKSMSHAADGNRNGEVDIADYTVWRDHYQTGLNAEAAVAVPEPTGLSLLAIVAVAGLSIPRCRRHLRREIIVSQTLPAELWTGV